MLARRQETTGLSPPGLPSTSTKPSILQEHRRAISILLTCCNAALNNRLRLVGVSLAAANAMRVLPIALLHGHNTV